MPNLQSDFEEKLHIVKNNYLERLNEKYILLKNLKVCIFKTENLQEAYGHIHKLSGSSAMFGFYELGQASNKLELLLKEFMENDYSSDKKVILQNFNILLNEIEKAIAI